jgi:hypothetical protein
MPQYLLPVPRFDGHPVAVWQSVPVHPQAHMQMPFDCTTPCPLQIEESTFSHASPQDPSEHRHVAMLWLHTPLPLHH